MILVWPLWLFVKLRRPVTRDRRIDLIGTVYLFRSFVRFLFYLFLLKNFGFMFLCVHIKRCTCALKFLVSKRRITFGYCATFRGEGHEGIWAFTSTLKMFSFFFFESTYSIPLHKLVSLPSYFRKQVSYFLFRYFLTFFLLSALYHCSFTEVWSYIQVATSTEKTESRANSTTWRYSTNQGYRRQDIS